MNGIDAHNRCMTDAIEADGIYIKLEDGYGYTVGLAARSLPELVMFGSDPEQIRARLFDLHYAIEHQVLELKEGPIVGLFFEEGAALERINDDQKERIFYGCRTLFGEWQFDALKVVCGAC